MVEFLGIDGDSGPIYLWRERFTAVPKLASQQASTGNVAPADDAGKLRGSSPRGDGGWR